MGATVMSRPTIDRRDAIALVLAAAAWGVGTIISKRALDEFDPLGLLPLQLAASVVALTVLMWRRGLSLSGSPPLLARLGLLNPGLAYALGLLGLTSIAASLSVLLWAVEPLAIALLAAPILGERLTLRLGACSLLALAGVGLLVQEPEMASIGLGVALTLAGVACCAVYTVLTRRWLPDADSTAQVVVAQQAYALVFAGVVAAAAAIVGGATLVTGVTPVGLASAIGSGLLYYAAAYWLYLGALRRVPASVAASSFYLIPLFGVAAGRLVLGDQLEPLQWLGGALLMTAVAGIVLAPAYTPRRSR
jgi:drug/metabolite transporter (DMT)-like permease